MTDTPTDLQAALEAEAAKRTEPATKSAWDDAHSNHQTQKLDASDKPAWDTHEQRKAGYGANAGGASTVAARPTSLHPANGYANQKPSVIRDVVVKGLGDVRSAITSTKTNLSEIDRQMERLFQQRNEQTNALNELERSEAILVAALTEADSPRWRH